MNASAVEAPPRIAHAVWRWFSFALIGALGLALFGDVLVDLAKEWWTESNASYGMLIPPFTLYVIYLQRSQIQAIPEKPDLRGLMVVVLACCVYLTGRLASEFFLTRTSLVVLLAGLVATFSGFGRLRALAFPLILLLTMVPPPALLYNAAATPLQLFASRIATDLAQLAGVSVYRDGNIIHLASTSLGVAEACSGLHSLTALMVAALLLGFLEQAPPMLRAVVFVLSVPLAIAVNVLRVTGTAILADYNPALALGYYHSFSGWLIFVLGFGLLWLLTKVVFRVGRAHA